MGAMVTRWYMEEMGGSDSVRQWIGINPVNHGAALADKGDPLVPDWLGLFVHNLIGTKPAVKAMKTSSTEVETLNDNNLDNGVLYRVIVGINENEDASFSRIKLFGSIELGFGGKTIAMKFVDGKRKYWRTYLGDGVVALEQSQLAGKGIDCYEGLTHNTTTNNATVISRIIEYLKDPSKACMNNAPSTDSEFDLKFKAQEGNGGVLKKGMCLALYIPVGANINELEYTLTYLGSQLGMTIVSPSGQTLQENIDPVIGFYENENSIYYLISSPEEGIWSIRINAIDVPDAGEPYSLIAAIYNESDFPTDDVIAPATSILLEGTLENNCYSSSVNVTLISIDNTGGSGINNTQYSINGTPWSTYASPFTILDVGETTIYYFSTDNAGNVETEQEAVFRIANITNPLPGCTNPPQDLDNDGFYEDVNGDGVFSFGDIRLFFEYYDVWIPANEPIACFDYDGNGFIGFGDVRALFWMWGT
ncbi:MAG: hypothetical protein APR53_04135 [Methanoculleus sp. SDB]|nr:MAG: hypothetical protein APR53_04135 [Methanoculleus sp. SDB]